MPDAQIDAIRSLLAARPRAAGLAERRARLDALGSHYSLASDVATEAVDAGGAAAEWTRTPVADASRVVLFFHGGGYVAGSLASHRHMVAELGRQARATTLAVDYRLAPEHPFPAALDDALAAYRFLLGRGFRPDDIAIAGESAGGGLAVAGLVSLRDAGDALPACAWLSSPWTDLEMSGDSMDEKAAVDPLISREYLRELAAQYLAGADARGPLVSPLYADLRGLPPLLVDCGSAETLLDDSVRLARAAGLADVRVDLRIWPDMIHAFSLFYQQVDAGRRALVEAGAFIAAHFGA
jgi:acetyl esterase/lipase